MVVCIVSILSNPRQRAKVVGGVGCGWLIFCDLDFLLSFGGRGERVIHEVEQNGPKHREELTICSFSRILKWRIRGR